MMGWMENDDGGGARGAVGLDVSRTAMARPSIAAQRTAAGTDGRHVHVHVVLLMLMLIRSTSSHRRRWGCRRWS